MIDYETVALQMPDQGGLFIKDGYHVQPAVQVNVMLNVLLNEYVADAQRKQSTAPCRVPSRSIMRTNSPQHGCSERTIVGVDQFRARGA